MLVHNYPYDVTASIKAYFPAYREFARQKARASADKRVRETRGLSRVDRLVTEGHVRFHYVMSPPGAGSIITSRYLAEKGNFDAWLLEPGGQFHDRGGGRDHFSLTLAFYQEALTAALGWTRFVPGILKLKPMNVLVTEKPQHHAPGPEMDHVAGWSERPLFLIRNPDDCMRKRLRLSAEFMANSALHLHDFADLIQAGFVQEDTMLKAQIASDNRDEPIGHKIRDYAVKTNDYRGLGVESWFDAARLYGGSIREDIAVHRIEEYPHDIQLSWVRYWLANGYQVRESFGRYYHSLPVLKEPKLDPTHTDMIRRVLGWDALEEFYLAKHGDFTTPRNRSPLVVSYENFAQNPEDVTVSILAAWGVPLRRQPKDWREIETDTPYGILSDFWRGNSVIEAAFGRALFGEKVVDAVSATTNEPLQPPEFLAKLQPETTRIYNQFRTLPALVSNL